MYDEELRDGDAAMGAEILRLGYGPHSPGSARFYLDRLHGEDAQLRNRVSDLYALATELLTRLGESDGKEPREVLDELYD